MKDKLFSKIIKYLHLNGKYKNFFIMCILLSIIVGFFNVYIIKYGQMIVDAALSKQFHLFRQIIITGVIVYLSYCLLSFVRQIVSLKLINKTDLNIVTIFINSVLYTKPILLLKYHSGELISRLSNDAEGCNGIYTIITQLTENLSVFIFTIIYLSNINLRLTILGAFMAIIFAFIGRISKTKIYMNTKSAHESMTGALTYSQDVIINKDIVKTYNYYNKALDTVKIKWDKFTSDSLRSLITQLIYGFIADFIVQIYYFILIIISGLAILNGQLTVGGFIAFTSLFGNVFSFGMILYDLYNRLIGSAVSFDRTFEILDLDKEGGKSQNILTDNQDYLNFANVSFKYNEDKNAVENIDFSVNKGEKVAFVGPSGSGKSTIFALIEKLYDPDDGRFTFEGKDVNSMDIYEWRNQIAVVEQETSVFYGTIKDNITMAKPDCTEDELKFAIETAGLKDFIKSLPEGVNTIIGEKGSNISGGQKQRIGIARAVLKNAPILLLDEAMSSLDAQTEKYIAHAIDILSKDKTIITISHRISSVVNADKIYVVDKGHIVEQGKHADLMNNKGLYYKLFTSYSEQGREKEAI